MSEVVDITGIPVAGGAPTESSTDKKQRKRRRTDVQLLADYLDEQRRHAAGEKVRITLMRCPGCNNVYTRAARHLCGGGSTQREEAGAASSSSSSASSTPQSPSDSSPTAGLEAGEQQPAKRRQKGLATKQRQPQQQQQRSSASSTADWKAVEQQDTLRWQWSSAMRTMEQICAQSAATFYLPNPETLAKCVTVTDELQQLNQQLWQAQSAREAATRRYFGANRLERAVQVSTSASGVGVRVQFKNDETSEPVNPSKRAKRTPAPSVARANVSSSSSSDDEDDEYSAMSLSDNE
jgi:hypothetical protein